MDQRVGGLRTERIIVMVKTLCNKFGLKSILITCVVMVITCGSFLNYISNELAGNIEWLILPSSYFGVPEALSDEIEVLCEDGAVGWDGQFYYYIANDILGLKDTVQHIDAPSYRYQRIGLPFLARIFAWILGQKNVSVEVFTLVYLIILAIASYVFARYLEEKNSSVLWILPWILSVGVQITLRHALPDGAADAFMLFAIILLLKEKYLGYSIAITIASLCREANISIAAIIFILGFFGILKKEKKFNLKFACILAFPGIVFVLWYLYVTLHFGAFPFSQAYGITDFFMRGFIEYLGRAISERRIYEIVGLIIYAISIFIALGLEVIRGKRNKIWLALLPFTVLVGAFGPTVMSHYSGYLKGISSLYIYIPLMLLEEQSLHDKLENERVYLAEKRVTAFFMMLVLLTGIWTISDHAKGLMPTKYKLSGENDEAKVLTDFSSLVSVNYNKGAVWVDMPYAELFGANSKYTVVNVHAENLSNEAWSYLPNKAGANAVFLSYHWFRAGDMDTVIKDGMRNSLRKDVQPGENIDIDMYIEMPEKPGQYVLRITLLQEGVSWFYHAGVGYTDINYVIK